MTDEHLLAPTMYLEDRGEPDPEARDKAMTGIGWVILLRVAHPSWMGKTIHEVILKPNQFSEYNSNDPEYVLAEESRPTGISIMGRMRHRFLRIAKGPRRRCSPAISPTPLAGMTCSISGKNMCIRITRRRKQW